MAPQIQHLQTLSPYLATECYNSIHGKQGWKESLIKLTSLTREGRFHDVEAREGRYVVGLGQMMRERHRTGSPTCTYGNGGLPVSGRSAFVRYIVEI